MTAPLNLFNYLRYIDSKGRERMVTTPAMKDTATNVEASDALHVINGYIRSDVLLQSHRLLAFECENPYMKETREVDRERLDGIAVQLEGLPEMPTPNPELLDHYPVERNRSMLSTIKSVFLPDMECQRPTNFLKIKHRYGKSMPIFFPSGGEDFDDESRPIPVSELEFVNHYLRYLRTIVPT